VFTWPEGNAWLVRELAAPLRPRLHTGRTVLRVQALRRGGWQVLAWDENAAQIEAWTAASVVLALPLFVARHLLADWADPLTLALHQAVAAQRHAPWLVANLHLAEPLLDRPGAPPSWDNLLHRPAGTARTGLGYVDAMHQRCRPSSAASCWPVRPKPGAPGCWPIWPSCTRIRPSGSSAWTWRAGATA
jgi:hypothetical protein